MKRRVIIEGILILVISLVVMTEGFRLITHKVPHILYDRIGPGYYIFILGIALMVTLVFYFIPNYRKSLSQKKVAVNNKMGTRAMSIFGVFTSYIFLVHIVGYLASTIFFFLLEFRICGVKSWRMNVILTFALTIAYYIIFVKYCDMIFPKGAVFR